MDNVLNRPLFRHREARDRLNDIAGVQRFQVGGDVRPEGLPSMLEIIQMGSLGRTTPMVGSVMSAPKEGENAAGVMAALNERLQDPNLRDNERRAVEKQRAALEFAINAGYGAADAVTDAAALLNYLGTRAIEYGVAPVVSMVSPSLGESIYDQIPMFDAGTEELARMGQAVPSNLRPSDIPRTVAFEAAGRGTPPLRPAASGMEAEARESRPRGGLLPTPGPTPESEFKGPSGMEQEARGRGPMTPALGPSGMEQEARGRGPLLSDPTAVAAGLNAEDPEVRDKTIADFMKEYTDAAPKYEGMDKGLLLAQIGFAIAAGESPNAMQNIANGLLAGSDAMLKDKAAKDEFDRQVQLNAMQYGFTAVQSEREKGKPALQFIATKDMTWKGRPIKKGNPVYLSYKDIADAEGVVPDGLVDAATSTALAEKQAGVVEALREQYDRGLIDDAELRQNLDDYTKAASEVARSQRALDYFERALFKIGEDGTLTGIPGAFQKLVGKMGAAAGFTTAELDALAKSGDAAEMEELLLRGVMDTVPSVVEGQSANSISDTDVRLAVRRLVALATQQGTFSSLFTSEDTVIRQVQDAMNLIAGNRQRSFGTMSRIEGFLTNRVTKAGDFYSPAYASDLLVPVREAAGLSAQPDVLSSYGDMILQENGSYKLIFPGG